MSIQIQLRWTSHPGALVSTLQNLLKKDILLDVTLAAEGQYVRAHKVMLCACSPYFEELLSISEDKHPIIMLQDVKYAQLQALVAYMYYGEVSVDHESLESLLRVGESLQIRGLFASAGIATGKDDLVKNPSTSQQEYQSPSRPLTSVKRDGCKDSSDSDGFNSTPKRVKNISSSNGNGNCVIRLVRANLQDSSQNSEEEREGAREDGSEDIPVTRIFASKTEVNHNLIAAGNKGGPNVRSAKATKKYKKDSESSECHENGPLENIVNRENMELRMDSTTQDLVAPYFEDAYLSNDDSIKDNALPTSPSIEDDEKDEDNFHDNGNGPDQIFKCKCGKQYTSNKSLWRHRKFACEGKQTFSCHLCGKIFSRSDNLRRHAVVAHCIQ